MKWLCWNQSANKNLEDMKMKGHNRIYLLVSAAALVTALTAITVYSDQDKNDPPKVTHQIETFVFTNDTGLPVDGLVVTFDARDVKTTFAGTFAKAVTMRKEIALSKGMVGHGDSIVATFERDGAFQILSWQWTANEASAGGVHGGPPVGATVHGGPPIGTIKFKPE